MDAKIIEHEYKKLKQEKEDNKRADFLILILILGFVLGMLVGYICGLLGR